MERKGVRVELYDDDGGDDADADAVAAAAADADILLLSTRSMSLSLLSMSLLSQLLERLSSPLDNEHRDDGDDVCGDDDVQTVSM
jgi:hypothetical protein